VCSSASRGVDIASIVANVAPNEVVGNVLIGVMLVGVETTGRIESVIVFGVQGQSTRTIKRSHGASLVVDILRACAAYCQVFV